MIRAPSLIPAPRVIGRKKSRRIRAWVACVGLTAALGAGGTVLARASISDPNAASESDLETARARLDELTAERDALRARLADAAATLRAARVAGDHPDWSILLAYVADLCGERIQLSTFALTPRTEADGFNVRIEGAAPSQQATARFVIGLEESGVFSGVRIERSGGLENAAGVPFSVVGVIRTGPPPEPVATEEEG
jgi:Tfp pilus assembly protein PilN